MGIKNLLLRGTQLKVGDIHQSFPQHSFFFFRIPSSYMAVLSTLVEIPKCHRSTNGYEEHQLRIFAFLYNYLNYLYHGICLTSPQNSKITSNKFSSVEKTMNSCFLAYLALLLLEVIITLMIIITLVLVNHENMRN